MEVTSKIVNNLSQQTRPVDAVDRTDFVFFLEIQVVRHRFDHVLAVVKHALNGDVVDILVHQTEHLRLLEGAHATLWAGHEDAHAALSAHGVLGRAASVATGCAKNVQRFATARQLVFKQIAEQLHRHVLERQRWAVGQSL